MLRFSGLLFFMSNKEGAVISQVIEAINEFHATNDPKRRGELDAALSQLKKCKLVYLSHF